MLVAIDLGGTKLAGAIFSKNGQPIEMEVQSIAGLPGREVGRSVAEQVRSWCERSDSEFQKVEAVGISVPGIYNAGEGTVWAPNIAGWESYPLLEEIQNQLGDRIPVRIESDRNCYIRGEVWQGNAKGSRDAIYVAVGTGIGAGIMAGGRVLDGVGHSAGSIGWMALDRPFRSEYGKYGCFEYHASGSGLARIARQRVERKEHYDGALKREKLSKLTAEHVFEAYQEDDPIAIDVVTEAIRFWGMAVANLISIFNPGTIVLGGGVFDSAAPLLQDIQTEARRWAQPIAMDQVTIGLSGLGGEAGLYGAAHLALSAL